MNNKIITLTLSRIFQVVFSLLALKASMYFLAPAEMGRFYILSAMISFVCFAILSPIGQYTNRHIHEWKNVNSMFYNVILVLKVLCGISVVYTVIIMITARYFESFSSFSIYFLMLMAFAGVLANSFSSFIPGLINILGDYKKFSLLYALNFFFVLVFSVLLVIFFDKTAEFWISGRVLGQVVISILALGLLWRIKDNNKTRLDYKALREFSIPLGVTAILIWIQNEGYRFIVEYYVGLEYLGLLAIGFSLATRVTSMVETLSQQLYLPDFYNQLANAGKDEREQAWNKIFHILTPVYVGTLILIISTAPYILSILGTDSYKKAFSFIIYGGFIEFFRVISNLLAQIAHTEKYTKSLIRPYWISIILYLLLLFLSAKYSVNYLPVSLVVSGLVTTIVMFIEMRSLMKIKLYFARNFISIILFSPMLLTIFIWNLRFNWYANWLVCLLNGIYYLFALFIIERKLKVGKYNV